MVGDTIEQEAITNCTQGLEVNGISLIAFLQDLPAFQKGLF